MEAHNYNQFIIEQKIILIFLIFFSNVSLFSSFSAFFCHLKETQQLLYQLLFSMHFFCVYQCVLPCNNFVTTIDLKISDEKIQRRIFIFI